MLMLRASNVARAYPVRDARASSDLKHSTEACKEAKKEVAKSKAHAIDNELETPEGERKIYRRETNRPNISHR